MRKLLNPVILFAVLLSMSDLPAQTVPPPDYSICNTCASCCPNPGGIFGDRGGGGSSTPPSVPTNGLSARFPYLEIMPPELLLTAESNQNLQKYWNYRAKLRNQFVDFTTDKGGCEPVESIMAVEGFKYGQWGDTTTKIGWYIGVLATEIYMLRNPSAFPGYGGLGDLHNATVELYCALLAIERLDRYGEQMMWDDHPYNLVIPKIIGTEGYQWPSTPGYFVRDDVVLTTMQHLGLTLGASDASRAPPEIPSPFPTTGFLRTDKEMSQDQVAHLLIGLALVKKFVPADVVYNDINLRGWAIFKTRELIDYVDHGHNVTTNLFGLPQIPITERMSWIIEEPVTPRLNWFGECPVCVGWFNPFAPVDNDHMDLVKRGPYAYAYAQGYEMAGRWITGYSHYVPITYSAFWFSLPILAVSTDSLSSLVNAFNKNAPDILKSDNLHMAMALAAVGDSWGPMTPVYLTQLDNYEDFKLYTLLNVVLHHPGFLTPDTDLAIQQMLRTAPYGGTAGHFVPGWSSQNRFIKAKDLHDADGSSAPTAFHGLDYMLLNNLYYIARPDMFGTAIPTDRPPLVNDMVPPNWPAPPNYKIPPIGYAVASGIRVLNQCKINCGIEIPITIQWDDPGGHRDTVRIDIESQPQDIGYVTLNGAKNEFVFHGAFWDRWVWEGEVRFRLTDEDGNTFTIKLPISYPGAVRQPPDIGAVGSLDTIKPLITWKTPWGVWTLAGTAEFTYTVYAIDKNCVPWKPTNWFVSGMSNVIAWPLNGNKFKAVAFWSILNPHGSGTVTILSTTEVGTAASKDIGVSW